MKDITQGRIIKFMDQLKIFMDKKIVHESKKLFYTEQDKKALVLLLDRISSEMLEEIYYEMKEGTLDDSFSPFCLLFKENGCLECPYGKHHGQCWKEGSDDEKM